MERRNGLPPVHTAEARATTSPNPPHSEIFDSITVRPGWDRTARKFSIRPVEKSSITVTA